MKTYASAALALLTVAAMSGQPAFSKDGFEAGYDAFQAGQFEKALEHWRPLADAGDARAQFNVGVMYADGRGMPQNPIPKPQYPLMRAGTTERVSAERASSTLARATCSSVTKRSTVVLRSDGEAASASLRAARNA